MFAPELLSLDFNAGGDTALSAAIKEAYASAPINEVIYHTLEIRHPAFAAPIRVVRDFADLTATLEASAPQDPGVSVTFVGFAFDMVKPEVNANGSPQVTIEIDNVSREILAAIEAAMQSTEKIQVTYREFLASGKNAGPENDPPMHLTILSIKADVFKVSCTAGFGSYAQRKFPAQEYGADRFPGLIAQ